MKATLYTPKAYKFGLVQGISTCPQNEYNSDGFCMFLRQN